MVDAGVENRRSHVINVDVTVEGRNLHQEIDSLTESATTQIILATLGLHTQQESNETESTPRDNSGGTGEDQDGTDVED